MGYALFFARKLSLNSRINQMNAQLMIISNQQNELTNEISAKQNAANYRSAAANSTALKAYTAEVKKNAGNNDKLAEAEATLNEALSNNQMIAADSNVDIMDLQSRQNALDLRRETLETQLNAAQQELQAVEKAEESAIKSSTAKYVG